MLACRAITGLTYKQFDLLRFAYRDAVFLERGDGCGKIDEVASIFTLFTDRMENPDKAARIRVGRPTR